jgi:branched-chain amino acid aminotransferase
MEEHVDRLYRSLSHVRIDPGISSEEMQDVSEQAIQRNEHLRPEIGDYTVHQFVTRGHGRRAWQAVNPTVCVRVAPVDFANFAHLYEGGMHASVTNSRSYDPSSLDPKVKHYSRLNFNLAELEANDIDPGALPILLDHAGNVTEGTGYNVFIVTNGILRTPGDRSILQGVSRGMVFDLARQLNIPFVEEDLQPYDVYTADEAFFCTTSWSIMPVTYVDRRPIGNAKPGTLTTQLISAWSESVGVDIVGQAVRFATK